MLHAALRRTFGDTVMQAGSSVTPRSFRFDFSHGASLTASEISELESWVNSVVTSAPRVRTEEMPLDDAKVSRVRVVTTLDNAPSPHPLAAAAPGCVPYRSETR